MEQVDTALTSVVSPPELRRRGDDTLSEAERDFEQAVRTVGFASEAAVRLARVRLLRGQRERARDVLDRVLAGDPPADIRYLACLFRASAAEQLGDLPAATRDYEAAMTAVPGAVPPMLALARLADEHNRLSEAREWIERALTSDTGIRDPWRRYVHGQAWQTTERVAALRTFPN
jgi:thioredoxin-like negative regulator of GroEL